MHALRHETARRRFLQSTASLLPAALIAPAHAADEKSAVFSGGAACYLQPFFDEIRYKGVTRTEVGRIDDAASTRALRVFYNPDKCSYKALLGVYWRHVDPTRATQFPLDASEEGDAFRTVVWVADAEERKLADADERGRLWRPWFALLPRLLERAGFAWWDLGQEHEYKRRMGAAVWPRRRFLDAFRAGDYRILVTSKVLNEGVDVPEANVAIVVSGSGSIREHVQRLGRVLRARPGKRATLYELIARDTGEYYINERRRQHRAYERFS